MYNQFWFSVIQRIDGRKAPAILEEITGVSERTWRKRFKHGWNPDLSTLKQLEKQSSAHQGSVADEQGEVELPFLEFGAWHTTAHLIYSYSPGKANEYEESIAIATYFDYVCHALVVAKEAQDLEGGRKTLIDSFDWLLSFCSVEEAESEDARSLRAKLLAAESLDDLFVSAQPIGDQLLFHVLSCWDVEFCSQFFAEITEPYPLFELLMPRLSPSVEIQKGTYLFLRNGQPPKRKMFETSISRLLDFIAVLSYWKKYRVFPQKVPSTKELAAWSNENEGRITSWRDETTNFTLDQFWSVWQEVNGGRLNQNEYAAPLPMLVVAHLFSQFLVRENGKPKQWFICFESYERWWRRNLDRLTAKGKKFGSMPWPKCLTDQPSGNRSPDSWRSSQSSGRSSHPLDSQ